MKHFSPGTQRLLLAAFVALLLVAPFVLYPQFLIEIMCFALLAAALALHVCGALYHQFILRDGLITRMSFGASTPGAPQDGEPAAL